MEGGTRSEFLIAGLLSLGAVLLAVGVGLLLHDPNQPWLLLPMLLGPLILWTQVGRLRSGDLRPLASQQPAGSRAPNPHRVPAVP